MWQAALATTVYELAMSIILRLYEPRGSEIATVADRHLVFARCFAGREDDYPVLAGIDVYGNDDFGAQESASLLADLKRYRADYPAPATRDATFLRLFEVLVLLLNDGYRLMVEGD